MPDPTEWASVAAAAQGSVLLKTARTDAENRTSYLFAHPRSELRADVLEEIPALFEQMEQALDQGCWVAGFLGYEAGYAFEPAVLRPDPEVKFGALPLAWFGIYDAPASVVETSSPLLDDLPPGLDSPVELAAYCDASTYAARVELIRRYIEAGDIYQANLTMGMRFPWAAGAAPLFRHMIEAQSVAYGALINMGSAQILSASPELFFRKSGGDLIVRPMKGTAGRGRDIHEDAARAVWLAGDEKNRAENLMIVDLLRNDLGRVCEPGSVHVSGLFRVETYPSVLQMTSTIGGRMREGTSYYDLFRALFPCGSITGAPKIRAMQIIRELEREPRGIACGAIGYIAPGGDAVFSVAIRTLVLQDSEARIRVGSGITWDSRADAEYAECRLKAEFLAGDPEPFELIETMRWDGEYFLLDLHLERLRDSAAYFGFRYDESSVRACLEEAIRDLPGGATHRVRLTLARSGKLHVVAAWLELSSDPVSLIVADTRVDSADPFLRHKATRRALYDRTLAAVRADGLDDALFQNERGEVTEGAIHNLVIERDGELLTPPLDSGVLPGVFRTQLLRTESNAREAVLRLADLRVAERVFVCNSVRGMRPVRSIRFADGSLREWPV